MSRLDSLLKIFDQYPDDTFTMYGLAMEYISTKDYNIAEQYLKMIINKDSTYVPAYMQYAQLKENLNQLDEAKSIYRAGIDAAKKINDIRSAKEMENFLNDIE